MTPSSAKSECRLTIGMPLYNNALTIRRAIDSILGQSFGDFRLLVSDDGSTDSTREIIDEYAKRDSRVEVAHQAKNLNYGNFRFVLARASSPPLMFAAGDDFWHREYVQRMIDTLDRDPRAICAVSRVAFVNDAGFVADARGTQALLEDPTANILRFLDSRDDNSRMYGVFRTPVAQRAFPPTDFFAYDWAFSIGTLRDGTHIEVPELLMWRDHTDAARYTEYVRRDASTALSRLFPMLPLTKVLLFRLRIPLDSAVARQLVSLNVRLHLQYLHRYHPNAATLVERLVTGFSRLSNAFQRSR